MKNRIFFFFVGTCLLLTACNQQPKTNPVDTSAVVTEVTTAEGHLFSLLKEGKMDDALAMHINNADYINVREGDIRNYGDVIKSTKETTAKGVKSVDWQISNRSFLVINETNVLETMLGQRHVISDSTNMDSTDLWAISALWKKVGGKWMVAYVHSSTKK